MLLNTKGEIMRCDAAFPRFPAERATEVLSDTGPGRDVLRRYVKDEKVSCCPERVKETGGLDVLLAAPEGSYTFRIDSTPGPRMNGMKRGVFCSRFPFGGPGRDGTDDSVHR